MNPLYRPRIVRLLIAKLGFRLHRHVRKAGVDQQGRQLYRAHGKAHWHRPHNPHYLGNDQ